MSLGNMRKYGIREINNGWKLCGLIQSTIMTNNITLKCAIYKHHNSHKCYIYLAYLRISKHFGHCSDVIMSAMTSQITSLTIVYSTVCSGGDQRKHQSSASLAFVRGIHRWPVNSPNKWPVTRKMLPFDDVIMAFILAATRSGTRSLNELQWRQDDRIVVAVIWHPGTPLLTWFNFNPSMDK